MPQEHTVPIEIDAEQRKRDVVEAAARLIVAGGLEAVTFRKLARELGCSTTVISHYFANKSEVLRATYLFVSSRAALRRLVSYQSGATNLLTSLEEILPVGEDHWRDWVVWICFWTSALFDPMLAAEHKLRMHRTVELVEFALMASGATADAAPSMARSVMTVVYGIAVQAIFDPDYWTPGVQREALRQALQGTGFGLIDPAGR
jgi:AcrR family transcriptional regulator